ncbi:MAG: aminopeptidase P family N-terminal domain-containing protein [Ruminococcus sp.]
MAFQRDKVLGSCMTEDEEEAKMLNAILDELKLNALVITDPYNMRHVSGFSRRRGRFIYFSSPEGADHRFPLYGAGR